MQVPYWIRDLKAFPPILQLPFHFLDGILWSKCVLDEV